jgi:hypothetical protein
MQLNYLLGRRPNENYSTKCATNRKYSSGFKFNLEELSKNTIFLFFDSGRINSC